MEERKGGMKEGRKKEGKRYGVSKDGSEERMNECLF